MAKKVCIQPCLGINEALTTIGRQACYAAYLELGAEAADLGCAPALYAEVAEDIEFTKIPADCEDVADYGVVMPPMLIVDGFIAAAGHLPAQKALTKLIMLYLDEEEARDGVS